MKNSAWIIAIITLTISACTSQKQATSYVNDDVYNSSSRREQVQTTSTQPSNQGAQVITSPDNAKGQKPGSSTLENDYNDYSYSNRINRFNSKDTTVGYFDNSLAGSSSGGNTVGNEPSVNIYMGSGAGYGGYYNSPFSYGMGWGSPYSNWGWDYGWNYPFYGGYYGWGYPYYYGGYNSWYNPWYNSCCYCYGNNEWFAPNSSNSLYGSRKTLYRTDGGTGNLSTRDRQTNTNSSLNRNDKGAIVPANTRSTIQSSTQASPPSARTAQPSVRTVAVSQEKYRYTRPSNETQTVYQRGVKQRTVQVQNQNTRQAPAPRYSRPENANQVQRSGSAQSYSSPVYRQPKSSQEYLAPRTQNPGTTRATNQNSGIRSGSGSSNTGIRQNSTPSNNNRTYATPARSGSSGSYTPSRNNSNNVAPSRSGNSGSYSRPSNSNNGGSYSAPARSGGSSGGSSSGSGGSSGGGRRR